MMNPFLTDANIELDADLWSESWEQDRQERDDEEFIEMPPIEMEITWDGYEIC